MEYLKVFETQAGRRIGITMVDCISKPFHFFRRFMIAPRRH